MTQQLEHSREKLNRSRTERETNAAQRELEELRKLIRDREDEITPPRRRTPPRPHRSRDDRGRAQAHQRGARRQGGRHPGRRSTKLEADKQRARRRARQHRQAPARRSSTAATSSCAASAARPSRRRPTAPATSATCRCRRSSTTACAASRCIEQCPSCNRIIYFAAPPPSHEVDEGRLSESSRNRTMKSCPKCMRVFPDDAGFCPADGTSLQHASMVPIANTEDDPRLGSRLCNRYELRRVVADGGMGRVYEGIDKQTQTRVAVKVLHDDVSKDDVVARALQARVRDLEPAPARLHREGARLPARRGVGRLAARHGVPRRRGAPLRPQAREVGRAGAPRAHARADGDRPRRSARPPVRAPRPQARQPVPLRHARGRQRQDPRLRIGQGQEQGREEAHRARHDDRLAVLHGARAGAGPRDARRARRRLRARRDHLRVHHRHGAVHRQQRPVDPPRDPHEGSRSRSARRAPRRSIRSRPRSTTCSRRRSPRTPTSARSRVGDFATQVGRAYGLAGDHKAWARVPAADLAREIAEAAARAPAPCSASRPRPIRSRRPTRSRRSRRRPPRRWARPMRVDPVAHDGARRPARVRAGSHAVASRSHAHRTTTWATRSPGMPSGRPPWLIAVVVGVAALVVGGGIAFVALSR